MPASQLQKQRIQNSFKPKSQIAKTTESTTTWSRSAEAWSQQTGVYSHAIVIPALLSRLIPDGELEPTSGIARFLERCEKNWAELSADSGVGITGERHQYRRNVGQTLGSSEPRERGAHLFFFSCFSVVPLHQPRKSHCPL